METTPKFQNYIVRLAEKHGFRVNAPRQYLRLEMEDSWPLIIESSEINNLTVSYQVESVWGDIDHDSHVSFFTGHNEWVPMMFTPLNAHYRDCCHPNKDRSDVIMLDPEGYAELVAFCEKWADELQAQGWLENGRQPAN